MPHLKATEQAVVTTALLQSEGGLQKIMNRRLQTDYANALTALIEAGAKIETSRTQNKKTLERLDKLLSGDIEIRVGAPIVAFFDHTSRQFDESNPADFIKVGKYLPTTGPLYNSYHGEFICEPRLLFNELVSGEQGEAHK